MDIESIDPTFKRSLTERIIETHIKKKIIFTEICFLVITTGYFGWYIFDNTRSFYPPFDYLKYDVVGTWPGCEDIRLQLWRLFTNSLLHANLSHIIGNAISLLCIGSYIEFFNDSFTVLYIFTLGIIYGNLVSGLLKPYNALIGCSHGVYALYGSALPNYVTHFEILSRPIVYIVHIAFIIQIFIEIYVYYYDHDPMVAYYSHIAGFISGILSGFVLMNHDYTNLRNMNKFLLSCWSTTMSVMYIINWPPKPLFDIYKTNHICYTHFFNDTNY